MKEYALQYHREITQVLGSIRKEILLLFKTNDFLRAIDSRIGNPVNNFSIMNNYIWKALSMEDNGMVRMKDMWSFYKLKIYFMVYNFVLWFKYKLGIIQKEEIENLDIEFFN